MVTIAPELGLLRPPGGRGGPPRRRQVRGEGGDARVDGVRDEALQDHGAAAVQEKLLGNLQQAATGRT